MHDPESHCSKGPGGVTVVLTFQQAESKSLLLLLVGLVFQSDLLPVMRRHICHNIPVITVFFPIFRSYGSSNVQSLWQLWGVCTGRYLVFFIVDVYRFINILNTAAAASTTSSVAAATAIATA